MKIKRGDTVKVITGKDRGKTGKVEKTFPARERILVSGVNIVKKHKKKMSKDEPGGIISMEAPIHASNVMIVDAKTGKTARVKYVFEKDKKVRTTNLNSKL